MKNFKVMIEQRMNLEKTLNKLYKKGHKIEFVTQDEDAWYTIIYTSEDALEQVEVSE